jgi:peptidyl-prolyl cis-trans isomerase SurA
MRFQALFSLILLGCLATNNLNARDKFSAVIQVDEMIITQYEIDQRAKFFKLLNFPGNHTNEAKKSLIDDRLKMRAAKKLGIKIQDERLKFEMQIFANRANLTINEFAERLEKQGVDRRTWEVYMQIPILWFEAVNKKFASEISKSLNKDGSSSELLTGSELQVLLTEIIIPAQSGFEEEALQEAEKLRKIKSLEKFSEAAYKYSAAPTRSTGGKVKWQNLSDLPSIVKPLVAGLAIGEVTEPLPLPGGIAIFQLRNLRESKFKEKVVKFIDYLEFTFAKDSRIEKVLTRDVLECDDLYSFSKTIKNSQLKRNSSKATKLSKSLKKTLVSLDENEFILENMENGTTKLVMVCGRKQTETLSSQDIGKINQIIANKRLYSLANSYIDNLRQEAVIFSNE